MEHEVREYSDDDFEDTEEAATEFAQNPAAHHGSTPMNPSDTVAAGVEFEQNEREMAERKHLRSLRPHKVSNFCVK
jgi:hypothetical protein